MDIADGSLRWKVPVTNPHEPVAESGRLYVPFGERGLAALDRTDGSTVWSRMFGTSDTTRVFPPAATDDIIYVSYAGDSGGGGLEAVDADTGSTRWSVSSKGVYPPVLAGDVVFAGSNVGSAGVTAAYDASNGMLLWVSRGGGYPIVADGAVYTTGLAPGSPAVIAEGPG